MHTVRPVMDLMRIIVCRVAMDTWYQTHSTVYWTLHALLVTSESSVWVTVSRVMIPVSPVAGPVMMNVSLVEMGMIYFTLRMHLLLL